MLACNSSSLDHSFHWPAYYSLYKSGCGGRAQQGKSGTRHLNTAGVQKSASNSVQKSAFNSLIGYLILFAVFKFLFLHAISIKVYTHSKHSSKILKKLMFFRTPFSSSSDSEEKIRRTKRCLRSWNRVHPLHSMKTSNSKFNFVLFVTSSISYQYFRPQ
jgi:hypothetical protein